MPPLSDRQHDTFVNPAKMACRTGNLRVLREAAYRGCFQSTTMRAIPNQRWNRFAYAPLRCCHE